ncbi:cc-nbs-lrr resistance protein [Corchorus olitorius]|uniref:Cc-nbs-lrr resistance protein n=1 Tax=Corchorus olitorius TaxID=93759 RepID=A0A1R3HFK1_9ROSI|nr:cc-nbs-lrr resistance protein [Corchorus olitorius]
MAEGLVSSVLLQLANTTVENTKQEVKLVTGVENEIERLKGNFEAIQAVLEDAEEKQIVDKNVSRWLHKLKDVSYDMEDVLDEWDTAILKVRLQTNHGVESASLPKKMLHIKVNSLGDCWEEEAQRAKLQNKMHLTKLEMTLYLDSRYVEQEIQDRVIQALNPPPNLRFQVAMVVD